MARCTIIVVVVVAAFAVQNGQALLGFPRMGGMHGYQQQQPEEPLLTCISINPQDPMSQLRLTIRPDRLLSSGGLNGFPYGGGFGNDLNNPRDWMVEGVITPGSVQRQGSYYAVVTQFGRTVGGQCFAAALGPAIRSSHHGGMNGISSPFSPYGGMGSNFMGGMGGNFMGGMGGNFMGGMTGVGMGGFGLGGMGGGFMGGYGGQQQQQPAGVLSNRLILTTGVSSYSARLRGVSFNDINGGGIAICPQVHQGQCMGSIPMCCGITRDQVSATQTILRPSNSDGVDRFAFQGNGFLGQNGFGGGSVGGGFGGIGGIGGTQGGLINSEPFFDDDDDFFENSNGGRLEGLF